MIKDKKLFLLLLILILLFSLPAILSRFYLYIASIILLTGLLSTSLNIAIGYAGIYQFHHSVFYGIGAYTAALILTKTKIHPLFAFIAGPVASLLISVIMGIVCVRLSKLYFGMLQISIGSLIWAVVYRWYSFTGGDDGIHGIPLPEIICTINGAYYSTLSVVLICFLLIYRILNSPFGKALQCIRENPVRAEAIGLNVKLHQLLAIVVSGFFAGVAGVLFVIVDDSVFPDMMFWTYSLEILIMCLLGGMYTFLGPITGSAIIILLRVFISSYTEYWSMVLGIILTLVIIFMPDGIMGLVNRITNCSINPRKTYPESCPHTRQ